MDAGRVRAQVSGRITGAVAALLLLPLSAGVVVTAGPHAAPADVPRFPTVGAGLSPLLDGQDDGLRRVIVALGQADAMDPVRGVTAATDPATDPGEDAGTAVVAVEAAGVEPVEVLEWLNNPEDAQHLDVEDLSDADRELLLELQRRGAGGAMSSGAADLEHHPSAPGPAPAADTPDTDGVPVGAALSGVAGVASVTAVGDDLLALATSLSDAELMTLPGVVGVAPDPLRGVTGDSTGEQWALSNTTTPGADIRWTEAVQRASGQGVVVAVVDTGIDLDHPDLADRIWVNTAETCGNGLDDDGNGFVDDCRGWDFVNDDPTVDDVDGVNTHGTHVAATIVGDDDADGVTGVAPDALVMPLKVFHDGTTTSTRVANAIDYAVANGADVINLSLAGTGQSVAELAAVQRASDAGVVLVAGMGNDGLDVTDAPTFPAAYDVATMIAVAATDATDTHAGYSNHSATLADVHAPGSQILSAVPGGGLAYMNGTSMAAPHVAGAAALVIQRGASGAAVRSTIMATVEARPGLQDLSRTGGRLDAAAALGLPARQTADGGLTVSFESFDDAEPEVADDAVIRVIGDPSSVTSGQIKVQGRIGTIHEGQVYGLFELPLIVGPRQARTNYAAQVALANLNAADGGDLRIPIQWALPEGTYVMVVELVSPSDPFTALTPPQMIAFTVEERPDAPAPEPIAPVDPPATADPIDPSAPVAPTAPVQTQPIPSTPGPGPATGDPAPTTPPTTGAPGTGTPTTPPATGTPPVEQPPAGGGTNGRIGNIGNEVFDDPVPAPASPGGSASAPAPPAETAPPAGAAPAPPAGTAPGPAPGPGPAPAPAPAPEPAPAPAPEPAPAPAPEPAPAPPASEATSSQPTGGEPPAPEPVGGHVSPSSGRKEGGILAHVSVPEGIPAGSYVRFGGINAPVVSREDTRVMVQVPAHAIGLVDVEILTPAGEDLRIRNAFTYYDDTPAPVDVGPMPPRTALPSLDPIVPDPTAPVAGDPVVGDPGVGDPADPSPVDGQCRSTAARGDGNSGNGNGSSCGRVGDGNNGGRAGGLPRTPGQPRIDPVMFQVGRLTLIDLDGVGPLADIDGASVLSQVCRTAVCPGRTV